MKVYIYKGGQSLVAKAVSAVPSDIRKNAAGGGSDCDGYLERGGYRSDQYRTA